MDDFLKGAQREFFTTIGRRRASLGGGGSNSGTPPRGAAEQEASQLVVQDSSDGWACVERGNTSSQKHAAEVPTAGARAAACLLYTSPSPRDS